MVISKGKVIENLHPVKDMPGIYIGDKGRVYKEAKEGYKLVKQYVEKRYGFMRFNYYNKGKASTQLTHTLVWDAFGNRHTKQIVFLDGDKKNCRIDNLIAIEDLVDFYNKNNGGTR